MRLTPVGSPPPPWPDDEEYKPALGCWLWNPTLGELRLETNAAIFRRAMPAVWDRPGLRRRPSRGLQPVVCFVDRVEVPVKSVGKTFFGPVIQIIGWVERDNVPGWTERDANRPSAQGPAVLAAASAPAPAIDPAKPAAKKPAKVKAKEAHAKPDIRRSDPFDDPIPWA